MSYQLALDSAPTLFESKLLEEKKHIKDIPSVAGMVPFYEYIHQRIWVEVETGNIELADKFLKKYNWRWTGHFNTYTGRDYKTKKKKASRVQTRLSFIRLANNGVDSGHLQSLTRTKRN